MFRGFGPFFSTVLLSLVCAAQETPSTAARDVQPERSAPMLERSGTAPAPTRTETLPSATIPAMEAEDGDLLRLPPIDSRSLLQEDRRTAGLGVRKVRVGIERKLKAGARKWGRTVSVGLEQLGLTWGIVSSGAAGTRIHFTHFHLPEGASLFVYSPQAREVVDVFRGSGPEGSGEFWTQVYRGEAVRFQLAGVAAQVWEQSGEFFVVEELSHLYQDPFKAGFAGVNAGPCNQDATCYPEWKDQAAAVSLILFSSEGAQYLCSGSMVNNATNDYSPLYLTANHCITTEAEAASAAAYWGYRTSSCAGVEPDWRNFSGYSGMHLLASSSAADMSLLSHGNFVPTSVKWLGWRAEEGAPGASIGSLHYPAGTFERLSLGNVVTPTHGPGSIDVRWTSGVTEQGSSGGPLLNQAHELIGTLTGGQSSCTAPSGIDFFGKFATAYPAFLNSKGQNYLEVGLGDDEFAPNHSRATAAVLSNNVAQNVIARLGYPDWFEIKAPEGYLVQMKNPVGWMNGFDVALYRNQEVEPLMTGADFGNTFLAFGAKDVQVNRYFVRIALKPDLTAVRANYQVLVDAAPPPTPAVRFFGISAPEETVANGRAGVYTRTDAVLKVEYGTDAGFSSFATLSLEAKGNPSEVLIPFTLSGLRSDTLYYYRLALDNGLQVVRAAGVQSFRTPATSYALSTPAVNFGKHDAKTVTHSTVTLTNTGSGTLAVSLVDVQGRVGMYPMPFSSTHNCAGVPPGGTCEIDFAFEPWSLGYWYAQAFISSSAPGRAVDLTGNGSAAVGGLDNSPNNLFAYTTYVNTESSVRRFRYQNWGDKPLGITSINVSAPFRVVLNECPATLGPQAWCEFGIVYRPIAPGTTNGKLEVVNTGITSPTELWFTANAIDLTLSVSRPRRSPRSGMATSQQFDLAVALSEPIAGEIELICETDSPGTSCGVTPSRLPGARGGGQAIVVVSPRVRSARLSRASSRGRAMVTARIGNTKKTFSFGFTN